MAIWRQRSGMEAIREANSPGTNASHSSWIATRRAADVSGARSRTRLDHLRKTFSMGERSGELAGQGSVLTWWLLFHFWKVRRDDFLIRHPGRATSGHTICARRGWRGSRGSPRTCQGAAADRRSRRRLASRGRNTPRCGSSPERVSGGTGIAGPGGGPGAGRSRWCLDSSSTTPFRRTRARCSTGAAPSAGDRPPTSRAGRDVAPAAESCASPGRAASRSPRRRVA